MKTRLNLTIDSDLIEMAKVRKFKDPDFSISELVNNFLREFFGEEVKDLEKDKVIMETMELEKKLALLKAQKQALEQEEERQKKEKIEKYGREFDPETGRYVD